METPVKNLTIYIMSTQISYVFTSLYPCFGLPSLLTLLNQNTNDFIFKKDPETVECGFDIDRGDDLLQEIKRLKVKSNYYLN